MGETGGILRKSVCLFLVTLFAFFMLSLSAVPVLAQENETDPCAGVTCPDSTLECPDGFSASCSNACGPDTGCGRT